MPYANLDNVKLYYEIYGNEYEVLEDSVRRKPTLVVVHGGPGIDHIYYEVPTLKDAAEFAQVIFIDLRGNGRSIDANSNHWNLKQWATDLHDFCNTLGLEKPFIHGVSLGGWVVQLYAGLYPDQPGGIILTDTEAYLDMDAILNAFEIKAGKPVRDIAYRYFYEPTLGIMQEYFEKCIPLCSIQPIPVAWLKRTILKPEVSEYFSANERLQFNLIETNKKIKAPVLFLSNTTNPLHLLASAKKTAEAMINTQVEFIAFENCGLVGMDAREKGLVAIKKFLKRNFK